MPSFRYAVNDFTVTTGLRDLEAALDYRGLRGIIRSAAEDVLLANMSIALRDANVDGGFPPEFQQHVMDVLSENIYDVIRISASRWDIVVTLNLDPLGTSEDLIEGYHQGARLSSGGQLWEPYTGQSLKTPDPNRRYAAWIAVRYGLGAIETDSGHLVHFEFPEGAWEDTIQQRISIWGDKAPEYLYVLYGQEEWEPHVPPQPVIENFNQYFGIDFEGIIYTWLDEAIAEVERYDVIESIPSPTAEFYREFDYASKPVQPIYHGTRITQSRLVRTIEELGPSGRPRQRGQFYFRHPQY